MSSDQDDPGVGTPERIAEIRKPFGWTCRSNNAVQWWKDEGGADGVVVRHTAFSTAADAEKFCNVLIELLAVMRVALAEQAKLQAQVDASAARIASRERLMLEIDIDAYLHPNQLDAKDIEIGMPRQEIACREASRLKAIRELQTQAWIDPKEQG